MVILILLVLVGIGGNLLLGTWLAGALYKDSEKKAAAAVAFSLLGMIATAAILFAGCMWIANNVHGL